MSLNRSLTSLLFIVATGMAFPSAATAQSASSNAPSNYETTAEAFERGFFRNDRTYFDNRSFGRQFDFIFGIGSSNKNSFIENEIHGDTELLDVLYKDALEQQVSSDPIVRTRDLPNPYETSTTFSNRFDVYRRLYGR